MIIPAPEHHPPGGEPDPKTSWMPGQPASQESWISTVCTAPGTFIHES